MHSAAITFLPAFAEPGIPAQQMQRTGRASGLAGTERSTRNTPRSIA